MIFWEDGNGKMTEVCQENATFRGQAAWGKDGVVISQNAEAASHIVYRDKFDCNCAIILPYDKKHLRAIWAYCCSSQYHDAVRAINQKVNVTNSMLVKVPFDLAHWQQVAAEKYPDGLPEPEERRPDAMALPWPAGRGAGRHGTPGRRRAAAGYLRWPAELDEKMRLSKRARALVKKCGELAKFADNDGIACIPAVRGEEPAAERLLKLLAACDIELESDFDLDDWLRNGFFEEHCKLFPRPAVRVAYLGRPEARRLPRPGQLPQALRRRRQGPAAAGDLTYAYLGEWITRQKDGVKRGEGGAEDRLAAALELQKRLEAILAGEPPFDIFVRWKKLSEQPIGWEPDINDGVRMNIRPFLASDLPNGRKGAGILRYRPNIKWTKDRGKEPQRDKADYPWFWGWDEKTVDFLGGKEFDGNRWNDCHYTNKVKQAARDAAKGGRR